MSGLLSTLVGAASAALNLRPATEPPAKTAAGPGEPAFASVLSAALTPRNRANAPEKVDAPARDEEESAATDAEASGNAAVAGAAGAAGATSTTGAAGATSAAAGGQTASAEETATAEVSASGAVAADPTPAPNPAHVERDLEALNSEFRARLDKVIARMESEYGHDVKVVETVRDQARQEYLYAQGRTRPGPVVTWTRSSNHTEGRAADLLVDGTYDNPIAMVRLARIAREEGLRTLGSKDPGHVELPAGVRVERLAVGASVVGSLLEGAAPGLEAARVASPAQLAGLTQTGGMAQVAQVAQVARVAQVATVARVAAPGSVGGGVVEAPAAPPAVPEQPAAAMAGRLANSGGDSSNGGDRREGRSSDREPVMEASGDASPRVSASNLSAFETRGSVTTADLRGVPASFGAEAAERIARVLQLQDAAPTRPLTQMVLRMDNAAGGEDRIRVDLRGTTVGAAMNMGDPVAAARMQSELGTLQRALEGRGLQAEHLSVTGAVAGRELAEALRSALPSDPGQRSSQDSSSERESGNGRSGSKSGEPGSENPRQRSRKDSQQGRNT